MRVRIIFRGLILFRFDEPRQGDPESSCKRGGLTAWLVSDPKHAAMAAGGAAGPKDTPAMGMAMDGGAEEHADLAALHEHVPRIGIYARNAADKADVKIVGQRLAPGETRFELVGHDTPIGVFTTPGFDKYIPNIAKLRTDDRVAPQSDFYKSWIKLPHGTIRARDLVSWDFDANVPAEVAFMGTGYRGFVANEAVLDVGNDDGDFEDDDALKYLSVTSTTQELPANLIPLTKGTQYVDETDPNTVEILITNFAAQRRRGVFWSLHYQSLFDAAGYVRDRGYQNSNQFTHFVSAARGFDDYEWGRDLAGMDIGQPFPYIISDTFESPQGMHQADAVVIDTIPRDEGTRTKHEGLPRHLASTDPWARPICPLGQDDII